VRKKLKFHELGIIIRGVPVVNIMITDYNGRETNLVVKTALLSGLLRFAEATMAAVEYLECNNYHIIFHQGFILSEFSIEEPIITYGVIDKIKRKEEKKVEKTIRKQVKPILKRISDLFRNRFNGKNLSEVSQFREFSKEIEEQIQNGPNLSEQMFKSVFI